MSNGWAVAGILWVLGGAITAGAADAGAQSRCDGQHLKNDIKITAFVAWPLVAGMVIIGLEPGPVNCNYTIVK